jgi:hypothetical protein
MMDSRVLSDENLYERMEQCFASFSDVVYELEKPQIQGESFLRDPSVRPEPRAQERPEAFNRIDMDLMMTIPVIVPGIFPRSVTDSAMNVSPLSHSVVDVVFVREHSRLRGDRGSNQRLDGCLLHVFEHSDENLARSLNDAENRRLLLLQSAPSAG